MKGLSALLEFSTNNRAKRSIVNKLNFYFLSENTMKEEMVIECGNNTIDFSWSKR